MSSEHLLASLEEETALLLTLIQTWERRLARFSGCQVFGSAIRSAIDMSWLLVRGQFRWFRELLRSSDRQNCSSGHELYQMSVEDSWVSISVQVEDVKLAFELLDARLRSTRALHPNGIEAREDEPAADNKPSLLVPDKLEVTEDEPASDNKPSLLVPDKIETTEDEPPSDNKPSSHVPDKIKATEDEPASHNLSTLIVPDKIDAKEEPAPIHSSIFPNSDLIHAEEDVLAKREVTGSAGCAEDPSGRHNAVGTQCSLQPRRGRSRTPSPSRARSKSREPMLPRAATEAVPQSLETPRAPLSSATVKRMAREELFMPYNSQPELVKIAPKKTNLRERPSLFESPKNSKENTSPENFP